MLHIRGTEASSYGDGCGIKTGTDNTTQRENNSASPLSGLKAVKKEQLLVMSWKDEYT